MSGYYYDLHDMERRNFVHLGVAEEWEIGVYNWDESTPGGGPTLKTRIDDSSVATLISDLEVAPGRSKIKVQGAKPGNTLVRGFDPNGVQQALTQFVVRTVPVNKLMIPIVNIGL